METTTTSLWDAFQQTIADGGVVLEFKNSPLKKNVRIYEATYEEPAPGEKKGTFIFKFLIRFVDREKKIDNYEDFVKFITENKWIDEDYNIAKSVFVHYHATQESISLVSFLKKLQSERKKKEKKEKKRKNESLEAKSSEEEGGEKESKRKKAKKILTFVLPEEIENVPEEEDEKQAATSSSEPKESLEESEADEVAPEENEQDAQEEEISLAEDDEDMSDEAKKDMMKLYHGWRNLMGSVVEELIEKKIIKKAHMNDVNRIFMSHFFQ